MHGQRALGALLPLIEQAPDETRAVSAVRRRGELIVNEAMPTNCCGGWSGALRWRGNDDLVMVAKSDL